MCPMLTTSFGSGRFRAGFTRVCFPRARPWLARPWLGPSWRGGGAKFFFPLATRDFYTATALAGGAFGGGWILGSRSGPISVQRGVCTRFRPSSRGKIRPKKGFVLGKVARVARPPPPKGKGSGGERSGPEAVRTSSRASVRRRHHATKGAEVQGAEGQGRHALF